MAEVEVIKIDTGESAKSVADLKKEFKELQAELSNTKKGTQEYQTALEKLGDTRDQINDLNEEINALNPSGKIAAFTSVASNLAGGFQAATGAAALFGGQTKEVEEALLKVQAATAFAQGIQSIEGLTRSFEVLKIAIASINPIILGITAAIAAIAIAYKVWADNISEAAKNDALLNSQLEKQRALQEDINNELDRELNIKKALGVEGTALLKAELDAEIQRYAAIRTRQILLQQISDKTDEQREELKTVAKEEADTYNRLLTLRLNINKSERDDNKKVQDERLAKIKETNEKILAEEKAFRERRFRDIQDAEANNAALEEDLARTRAEIEQRESDEAVEAAKAIIEQNRLDEEAEYQYDKEQRSKRISEDLANKREAADESARIAEQESSARQQSIAKGFEAGKALSDLYFAYQLRNVQRGSKAEQDILKKQFNINKAFAITDATIKGVLAVQQALGSLPPPYSFVVAAASGILAAANIAKIASTKFDAGGGQADTSVSGGLAATAAPPPAITNPNNNRPTTGLNPDGSVKNSEEVQGTTKVIIVAQEMTEVQERNERLKIQSTF